MTALAGVVGKTIRYCLSHISIYGVIMRLLELFEGKPKKKEIPASTPRNFVAKHAKTSGAGSHSDKKYNRKEKHKGRSTDE